MADKLLGIAGWIILVAIALGAVFFVIQPIIWSADYAEWVVYARVFLLLMLISTFAQLRLFNAVVKNSLFLIRLRESVTKLAEKFPMLDRGLKGLGTTLSNTKNSVESLRKSVDTSKDATEKLTEKIDKLKNKEKQK